MKIKKKYTNNLELELTTNQSNLTICQHQYTTYPLRLSPVFRLEGANTNRAYLYLINTSPGLLANDTLDLALYIKENTHLYLTDQAANKVHPMPELNSKATVNNQIIVENNASLEFVPEPTILYQDSVLEQQINIKLYPKARLFLSEIVLPGRLARNEYYEFDYYFNRIKIVDRSEKILYIDAIKLLGKNNPFKKNKLFASLPIMGNAIAIVPDIDISSLIEKIGLRSPIENCNLETAVTILPTENGIALRALASKTREIKDYFSFVINCIRDIYQENSLPYIPK